MKQLDPKARAARAAQAAAGLLLLSAAAGAYDWRLGLAVFGGLLVATAGFWRSIA